MSLDNPFSLVNGIPDGPTDESPEDMEQDTVESPDGLYCDVCGKPLVYKGRGRKPTKCDEHKTSGSRTGVKSPTKTKGVEGTAALAASHLARLNGFLAMAMSSWGLPVTAQSVALANEEFQKLAYEALLADPVLAKKIAMGGAESGKAALIFAYGMFGLAVGPAAVMEIKQKREQNKVV